MTNYCPRCKSRLYPDDDKYMRLVGACGGCVTWNRDLGRQYDEAVKRDAGDEYVFDVDEIEAIHQEESKA